MHYQATISFENKELKGKKCKWKLAKSIFATKTHTTLIWPLCDPTNKPPLSQEKLEPFLWFFKDLKLPIFKGSCHFEVNNNKHNS